MRLKDGPPRIVRASASVLVIDWPMKRCLFSVALQLLLGLFTAGWFPAVAKNLPPEPAPTLLLRVHDDAGADPEILASAMDRVNAVYADAGVSTQWARVDGLAGKPDHDVPTLDVSIVVRTRRSIWPPPWPATNESWGKRRCQSIGRRCSMTESSTPRSR